MKERPPVPVDTRITEDALFGGRLTFFQPARGLGYRANVDALLLAAFAGEPRRVRIALDLGAGAGAVGLSLLHHGMAERVVFVERDPLAAELCRRNLDANGLTTRGIVVVGDVERPPTWLSPEIIGSASLVVTNPPYVAPARDGRPPRGGGSAARAAARRGDLAPFVRATAEGLGKRGRACFVYPAHALLELTTLGRAHGLEPKRLQFVHGKADRPARVALIELVHGKSGGLVALPPLIEHEDTPRSAPR
ncbi:MAG TPA: methyltransferase [Polyangiaceae bacterium]|nr:methyltransferase [Polyangiaceae bacterium]